MNLLSVNAAHKNNLQYLSQKDKINLVSIGRLDNATLDD